MPTPPDLDAVRSSYDRVAENYVAMGMGDLTGEPWLRAALAAFAEEVRGLGPVLDVGCGPGTTTQRLAALGLDVRGVDLSPRMIEHARRRHPGLPGGRLLLGMHVGDGEVARTEAYGGVPVSWTTHLWQPEQLVALLPAAGLRPVAELHIPAKGELRPGLVLSAEPA